jgi:hypothetical protein
MTQHVCTTESFHAHLNTLKVSESKDVKSQTLQSSTCGRVKIHFDVLGYGTQRIIFYIIL